MDLTEENKKYIDAASIETLLRHVRFARPGDRWFQGETGEYWLKRMGELRSKDPEAFVRASKSIGWEA